MVVNIVLLYLASQLGRYMSKLSALESEYFLAQTVNGQDNPKAIRTIPSKITRAILVHVRVLI